MKIIWLTIYQPHCDIQLTFYLPGRCNTVWKMCVFWGMIALFMLLLTVKYYNTWWHLLYWQYILQLVNTIYRNWLAACGEFFAGGKLAKLFWWIENHLQILPTKLFFLKSYINYSPIFTFQSVHIRFLPPVFCPPKFYHAHNVSWNIKTL